MKKNHHVIIFFYFSHEPLQYFVFYRHLILFHAIPSEMLECVNKNQFSCKRDSLEKGWIFITLSGWKVNQILQFCFIWKWKFYYHFTLFWSKEEVNEWLKERKFSWIFFLALYQYFLYISLDSFYWLLLANKINLHYEDHFQVNELL